MEWLKKMLEEQKLAEDAVKTITKAVEEQYKSHVPKHRFDEVNEAKKQLEMDIKERDKQLTELKNTAGNHEELKKQIETLQTENKQKDSEYQSKLRDLSVTAAIKLAVAGEVHDPDLIVTLLDRSKIELDDQGNIKNGLNDQVKALRDAKSFLFVEKKPGTGNFSGVNPPKDGKPQNGHEKNPWSKEHFNLTEQGRIFRENPELAKQLQEAATKK